MASLLRLDSAAAWSRFKSRVQISSRISCAETVSVQTVWNKLSISLLDASSKVRANDLMEVGK